MKLSLVYIALILSLFVSQNINQSDWEIFSFGFKNLSAYKEFLLFLSASLLPITSIMLAYKKYIDALVGECLKKLSPDESVHNFYSQTFIDGYFDWITSPDFGSPKSWHGFVHLILGFLLLLLVILVIALIVASFFIQISVIYDIATKPSTSQHINLFVLVYAGASILFSWSMTILQWPMPEIDSSNYSKLDELKRDDPDRYREIMQRFTSERAKRENFSTIISSTVIYMFSFTIIVSCCYVDILNDLVLLLEKSMLGLFVVTVWSLLIVSIVRGRVLTWFFDKYPDDASDRLRVFANIQKGFLLSKLIVPAVLSIAHVFLSLETM